MPIDYRKYPRNWKSEIRPAILDRANHECEECKVPNYAIGYWLDGGFHLCEYNKDNSMMKGRRGFRVNDLVKVVKIILTVSHTDHDVTNNDHSNLRALCQRCHLTHDREHHSKMRKINRRKRIMARVHLPLF